MIRRIGLALSIGFALLTLPAQAYVGPGMGLGAIFSAVAVLACMFIGLIGLIYFPIKRLINKLKKPKNEKSDQIAEK